MYRVPNYHQDKSSLPLDLSKEAIGIDVTDN